MREIVSICFWLRRGDESPQRILSGIDRKSTRLNSSHTVISYAVFCLKKKTWVLAALTRNSESSGSIRLTCAATFAGGIFLSALSQMLCLYRQTGNHL